MIGFTFQGKADIIFLVDSSSSIGKNHIKELQLVASIAEKYNLSPTASQAAVILFSNLAQIAITFNGGNSLRTFKDTVLRLPLTGSYSRLDHGLGATKTLLSNSQYGARRSVPKIVYIITAGERRNKGIISSAGSSIVQWLRKHNIHVIIFGIGKTLGKNDFQSVTDNPSNVFTVDGFDKILTTEFVNRLVSYSCRILGKCMHRFYIVF